MIERGLSRTAQTKVRKQWLYFCYMLMAVTNVSTEYSNGDDGSLG